MARVSVSMGSNIDSESNLRQAIARLREQYGELTLSPVYQTAAVGFDGDDFLNLVVDFATTREVQEVVESLKAIEQQLGRDNNQPKFSARIIDLDLLTYDDLVFRDTPALTMFVRERHPDLRLGVVGHSLGGHVLLAWLAHR